MSKTQHTIIAQTESLSRKETFLGIEYVVVPVVAMVEGVRFGVAQTNPELGLAGEFGKFPAGWNNRPVVMNHPTVDGALVSANDPAVLTTFSFGFTANTAVKDGKLRMEAWINPERCDSLGDETKKVLERVEAEEIIEVSVGFFSDVEQKKGSYNGQSYAGIWRNIVPDHLAFLSEGTKGACSVEAGCGTPRVNQGAPMTLKADTQSQAPVVQVEPKAQCGCDKSSTEPKSQEELKAQRWNDVNEHINVFSANLIANALLDMDVRKLLHQALNEQTGCYVYLIGFDGAMCVYGSWDSDSSDYKTFQVNYSIDGVTITLAGEPVEVTVITQVVPKGDPMTTQTTNASATPEVIPTAPVVPVVEPVAQAAPVVLTVQQYIEQAPAEMRDMLNSGMQMHSEKKTTLIKALKDTGRCKFGDPVLQAMSVGDLQNLVDLAAVPDYSGVRSPTSQAPVAQTMAEQTVAAPKVFEFKPKAA